MKGKYLILKRKLKLVSLVHKQERAIETENVRTMDFSFANWKDKIFVNGIPVNLLTKSLLKNNPEKEAIEAYVYSHIDCALKVKCGHIKDYEAIMDADNHYWLETAFTVIDLATDLQYRKDYFYQNFHITNMQDVKELLTKYDGLYESYQAKREDHFLKQEYRYVLENHYEQMRKLAWKTNDINVVNQLDQYYASLGYNPYGVSRDLILKK